MKHADIFRYLGYVSSKADTGLGSLNKRTLSRNINDNFFFFDIVILALL